MLRTLLIGLFLATTVVYARPLQHLSCPEIIELSSSESATWLLVYEELAHRIEDDDLDYELRAEAADALVLLAEGHPDRRVDAEILAKAPHGKAGLQRRPRCWDAAAHGKKRLIGTNVSCPCTQKDSDPSHNHQFPWLSDPDPAHGSGDRTL